MQGRVKLTGRRTFGRFGGGFGLRSLGFGFQSWQLGRRLGQSLLVVLLNLIVNLLPMHRNMERSFDANFNRVAFQAHDFDGDVTVNDYTFAGFAGENEHKE
jgi:hypothetical protein